MAKNRTWRRIVWTVLILSLLSGSSYGGWYWYTHQETGPKYQTLPIKRGDLTQAVTATGQLNPVVNVQVGSQISGMIEKLYVDYNSIVKAGQLVAKLDAATYLAVVHQAEGDLANANATLELTRVQAGRQKELRGKDLVPQADLDTAMANLHQAEANVKLKEASLEKAKVDLARCSVYSPIDGIVISRNVDTGQTVAASLNAPVLFVIANDLGKMQIDANVAEADIGNIATDQTVNFTVDAFPFRTFQGQVNQIRNATNTVQNVVTYDVVIGVNNSDLKLRPGMTANVSIIVDQRENALKIPNAALRFRMPGAATETPKRSTGGDSKRGSGKPREERVVHRTVYVLPADAKDETPKPVKITVGISDGVNTEVVEGLKEGENVVTGSLIVTPTAAATPAAGPLAPSMGGMRRF